MLNVVINKQAAKYISKLDTTTAKRINKAICELRQHYTTTIRVHTLTGEFEGYLRKRVGKYRIVFIIDPIKEILYIEAVDSRGDIYKSMR